MGYETSFNLDTDKPLPDEFNDEFEKISDYRFEDDNIYGKWYEWQDNMIEVSKRFPGILFTLSGEGEENDDVWRAYFKNGECKTVQPIITWPEVDLSEFGKKKKYI